jgi:hypothetical protein
MDDPEFMRAFSVFAQDAVECHYLLSHGLMRAVLDLREKFACEVFVSFYKNNIYLLLDRPNRRRQFFELSMAAKATILDAINVHCAELMLLFEVIDALRLNTRIWGDKALR